jgi:hypothetical protein
MAASELKQPPAVEMSIFSQDVSSKPEFSIYSQEVRNDGSSTNGGDHQHLVADPQKLRANTSTERMMIAFDVFLALIPIVLVVKAILVIIAAQKDRWHRNVDIGSVTELTTFLIKFNGQVSAHDTIFESIG